MTRRGDLNRSETVKETKNTDPIEKHITENPGLQIIRLHFEFAPRVNLLRPQSLDLSSCKVFVPDVFSVSCFHVWNAIPKITLFCEKNKRICFEIVDHKLAHANYSSRIVKIFRAEC